MTPARTVYTARYLATDGSAYPCSEQVMSRDLGQDMVDGKLETGRRVLRIRLMAPILYKYRAIMFYNHGIKTSTLAVKKFPGNPPMGEPAGEVLRPV